MVRHGAVSRVVVAGLGWSEGVKWVGSLSGSREGRLREGQDWLGPGRVVDVGSEDKGWVVAKGRSGEGGEVG